MTTQLDSGQSRRAVLPPLAGAVCVAICVSVGILALLVVLVGLASLAHLSSNHRIVETPFRVPEGISQSK